MKSNNYKTNNEINILKRTFGKTAEGQEIMMYSLRNKNDLQINIINYGGIIVNLFVPDRNNCFSDVVLGYDKLEGYIQDDQYFGAIIGRYGNRIANGEFKLEGKKYKLAKNNFPNGIPCHLHGGLKGLNKLVWQASILRYEEKEVLSLNYLSKDGEEAYPGNLELNVQYQLSNNNILRIEYRARSDRATPINMIQHSYFNLKGVGNGDILDHILWINADSFTPVDRGLIPNGEIRKVKNTPFDFTNPKKIGRDININDGQLIIGHGYDHNWVLNNQEKDLRLAAWVIEPESGRKLEVWTTEPGMQFYSGNFIENNPRTGFCLETQHYPDSPNKKEFPSTILKPGENYYTVTEYRFGIS